MRKADKLLAEIFRDNDQRQWVVGDILINHRFAAFYQIVRKTRSAAIVRPVVPTPAPPQVHPWLPGYVSVSRGAYLPVKDVFKSGTRERRATGGYARWDGQLALPAVDFSITVERDTSEEAK